MCVFLCVCKMRCRHLLNQIVFTSFVSHTERNRWWNCVCVCVWIIGWQRHFTDAFLFLSPLSSPLPAVACSNKTKRNSQMQHGVNPHLWIHFQLHSFHIFFVLTYFYPPSIAFAIRIQEPYSRTHTQYFKCRRIQYWNNSCTRPMTTTTVASF